MEPSDPIVWPLFRFGQHFSRGSINVVDCQDGILDLRKLTFALTMEMTTLIFNRCLVIYGDLEAPWTSYTYLYDTTLSYPCNVRCSLNLHAAAVRTTTQYSWYSLPKPEGVLVASIFIVWDPTQQCSVCVPNSACSDFTSLHLISRPLASALTASCCAEPCVQ